MNYLSFCIRTLRKPVVPRSVSYQIWKFLSARSYGRTVFFPIRLFGRDLTYGVVCGYTDSAAFLDLNEYETDGLPSLRRALSRDREPVVLDVGANGGQFLMICKALAPLSRVHCFEPFEPLCRFLRTIAEKNLFPNVGVCQAVAGESAGLARLNYADGSSDTASTLEGFQPDFNRSLAVAQVTIDDYVNSTGLPRVDLVKIDVEGGELEVLLGARRTIRAFNPDILLELLYTENPSHKERQLRVIDLLKELGYVFFRLEDEGIAVRQDDVRPDPNYRHLNFLLRPERSIPFTDLD